MNAFLNQEVHSFDTSDVDGTLAIGASFIFIAYILHPAVESAYQRVRAYRAWRAIEKRQAVEVTNYPMLAETLGGRGKWDTARIITVLLAVFSLVSWGLELSMDLAYHKGDADILNRSPPISREEASDGTSTWKVIPEERFDFERDWKSLSNVGEDSATSKYHISKADICHPGYVEGSIVVALWSDTPETTKTPLHYLRGDSNTTVTSLQCAEATQPEHMNISNGDAHWGSGVECEIGPALEAFDKTDTPPTLILNKTNEEVYLIVEESSNYPSFLYSVWTAPTEDGDSDSIQLNHKFYIAATVRLAEAVVTGIVHGQISGKYCFELVRMYSESGNQSDSELTRAEPFGEHPTNDSVRIEEVEKIECGLEVDLKAVIFFVCLMALTSVGIAWSLCLRSSIGMDVYDRDELIRAVSMSRGAASSSKDAPSSIRIFVRKEDTGSMSVAISETGDSEYSCARMFRSGVKVVEDDTPSPSAATSAVINQYNQGYGGAAIPVGSRTVWLEGVRTGMGRAFPGRNGNFRYPTSVALTASPVPSNACSSIPSNACSLVATPLRSPSPLPGAPREEAPARKGGGRGASVLFDLTYSSSDSGDNERDDDDLSAGGSDDIEVGGGGTPSACIVGLGGQGDVSASSLKGMHALDMGRGRGWVDRSVGNGVLRFSSGKMTPESEEGSTPESEEGSTPEPPPFLQRRERTFGPPPQLAPHDQDSRRKIIGFASSFKEVNEASNQGFSAV